MGLNLSHNNIFNIFRPAQPTLHKFFWNGIDFLRRFYSKKKSKHSLSSCQLKLGVILTPSERFLQDSFCRIPSSGLIVIISTTSTCTVINDNRLLSRPTSCIQFLFKITFFVFIDVQTILDHYQ